MIAICVPGEPVPFARAGSNGKRRYTPPKQANFMAAVQMFAQRAMAGDAPLTGPIEMSVRAVYLHPASWSQKKKDAARWKVSRPDGDNLAKLIADALNTIAFEDDAQIVNLTVQKVYGARAEVFVTIQELT